MKQRMSLTIKRTPTDQQPKAPHIIKTFQVPVDLRKLDQSLFDPELTIYENMHHHHYEITHADIPFNYINQQGNIIKDIRIINHLTDLFLSECDKSMLYRLIYDSFTGEDIEQLAMAFNLEDEIDHHLKTYYQDKSFVTQSDLDDALTTITHHLTDSYLS